MNTSTPDSTLIACPSCHAIVRVPQGRVADGPKCARCKEPVVIGTPITLDGQSFDAHTGGGFFPVLVDFWAPWCGPCRMMAPVLDRLASDWQARLQVGKVNSDEQQSLAARFGIQSIPTLILFKGGKEIARQSGAIDDRRLKAWIEPLIG